MPSETSQLSSPGFVAVIFDIPFPISVPNGHYLTHDPHKNIACISTILREGSRSFFRSRPVTGPTSFRELTNRAQELDRPRADHSYLLTSQLKDGSQKATLNIHTGADGGYAECKYYSEVHVTFLADSLTIINEESRSLNRACEILNPFLDKYRLFTEDYRVGRVSLERNFYFATCHTSPLTADEVNMTSSELFNRLFQMERTFSTTLGHGRANILRTNTLELLGPKGEMSGQALALFGQLLLDISFAICHPCGVFNPMKMPRQSQLR
jgi:hypothetical protein